MLLPNLLRKVFGQLFSRLSLAGFDETSLLRSPCPDSPRFRPALELLERRMMPSVTVTYTASSDTLVVNGASSTATAMTVAATNPYQVTLSLGGDTFTRAGDAANSPTSGNFILSNSGMTLTINTGLAPANIFDVIQRSNLEPLNFGLAPSTSGVGTVSITAPGDTVFFNAVNITGSLTDISGGIGLQGALSAGGSISLTGLAVGTGSSHWGVNLDATVTAGSNSKDNILITGSGSVSGTGSGYGVYGKGAISAGGSITIIGTGSGSGSGAFGVSVTGTVTAGTTGSLTITGIGSGSGAGNDYGVFIQTAVGTQNAVSAANSITITGTGQGTGMGDCGVRLNTTVTAVSSGNLHITGSGSRNGAGTDFGTYVEFAVSAGGSLTITGTGNGSGGNNYGVYLLNTVIAGKNVTISGTGSSSGSTACFGVNVGNIGLTAGGSVTITGTGQGSGVSNGGVVLQTAVTGGTTGNVFISGTSTAMGSSAAGVDFIGAIAGGNVTITGTGSSNGYNYGYGVYASGAVTAGGSITITGTGQGTGSNDFGIDLKGNVKSGASGAVTLHGKASATGYNNNYGVYVYSAVSGGGAITIIGTGNGTGSGNDGVIIGSSTAVVTVVNGALIISGSSARNTGSGSNVGVYIDSAAQVLATGSAAITITGTGGLGAGNNDVGVLISDPGTTITGSKGGITINGTGRGSGSESEGVAVLLSAQIQADSTGSVNVVGQAPVSTASIFFGSKGTSGITVATGNVVLTGDIIDLGNANTINSTSLSATSHLAFQAYTHGRAIVVGSSSDASNALTFTNTDLAAIAQTGINNGFGLITIGSASGANPMSFGGVIGFITNLSLQAQGGLTIQVPNSNPNPGYAVLNVEATLYLNNDPLHLLAPKPALSNGDLVTLIYTTGGTAGTTFLGQPQGSIVTETAGQHYYISYTGNTSGDIVLIATTAVPVPINPASPGAGTGRGRGRS